MTLLYLNEDIEKSFDNDKKELFVTLKTFKVSFLDTTKFISSFYQITCFLFTQNCLKKTEIIIQYILMFLKCCLRNIHLIS